jgi:glycosyltransferase involved in cell wall biosynthesis
MKLSMRHRSKACRVDTSSPVAVVLDGYWWIGGPPSGQNVVRSIVGEWARCFPDDNLTLCVPAHDRPLAAEQLQEFPKVEVVSYPSWAKVHPLAIASIGRFARHHDAVLTQNFGAPSGSSTSMVLVHDALFTTHPEWFTRAELYYLALIRPSLRMAEVVLTTSDSESSRLKNVWPETAERIVRVGLAVPKALAEAEATTPTGWNQSSPFVLSVGRLNVRKNLARLIDAFTTVVDEIDPHHLLIVGQPNGSYTPADVSPCVRSRVHFLGHQSDAELRWLYENCSLFVLPSLDEGFGLPLLEAQMFGAPAIASNIPCFREVGGALSYFNPLSVADIASSIRAGLGKPRCAGATQDDWSGVVKRIREAIRQEGL